MPKFTPDRHLYFFKKKGKNAVFDEKIAAKLPQKYTSFIIYF